MSKQQDEPSPHVRRTNFRYLGDLEPENENWWAAYGAALERAHADRHRRLPRHIVENTTPA